MNNVYLQMTESLQSVWRPVQIWDSLVSSVSFSQCKDWDNLKLDHVFPRAA